MALSFPISIQFPTDVRTVEVTMAGGGPGDKFTRTDWSVYPISQREIMRSNGVYVTLDKMFANRKSVLTFVPKLRDRLTWEDEDYYVIECNPMVNLDRFTCIARPLRLVYGLTEAVAIWRRTAASRRNAEGVVKAQYAELTSNVSARVQPADAGIVDEFGVTKFEQRYNVFLEWTDEALLDDQLRLADGRILEIESTADRECLDMIQRFTCVDRGATWQS